MRSPAPLFVAVLLVAGCRHTTTDYLAVGWSGDPPAHCRGRFGALDSVQPLPMGGLLAVKPGDTTLTCRDTSVTLRVVEPTVLTIEPVGPIDKGVPFVVRGSVSADGRGLALGDASITWTFPPGLRQGELCHQGTCVKASSARVTAEASGTYRISARFGALSATATLVVP